MKRTEDFPVSEEKMRKLIAEAEKQFGSRDVHSCKKTIYVNFSMVRMQAVWIIPKLLYARGLAEESGAECVVISWRDHVLLRELTQSFGMRLLVLGDMEKKDLSAAFLAVCKFLRFLMRDGSVAGFCELKLGDIPVGMCIYEDILRTSSLSTIRSMRDRRCVKKSLHLLWMSYALRHYLKAHPPLCSLGDDFAYHEGIMHGLFREAGADVFLMSDKAEEDVVFDEDACVVRKNELQRRFLCAAENELPYDEADADKALKARFHGVIATVWDRNAYQGKEVLDGEDIRKRLGLKAERKNVVIMAHTFSDGCFSYGKLPYRDYYSWLEATLKVASTVQNVNWILKPHPTRHSYNENEDSVEALFERYKKENFYFMPDEMSAESIRNFADVIVTVGGSGGGEFACCGIPALILGKTYYRGFGYTIEPKGKEEYEKQLRNIADIKPLTTQQIKEAKKIFYLNSLPGLSKHAFTDAFARFIKQLYKEMLDAMAVEYFESNRGTKKYNDRATDAIAEYFAGHDMRECEYFQSGKKRAERYR